MSKEAMKLALEALEYQSKPLCMCFAGCENCDPANVPDPRQAITVLREALAEQPAQQEPVAREHITDGNPCWCEPETNYTDPETGISVIVHKEPQ